MSSGSNRILLAITSDTTSELDMIAKKENISRTELIRRALGLYFVLDREIPLNSTRRKLAIVENGKIIERIIFR